MKPFAGNPNSVKAAQILFILNAIIWLLFGIVSLVQITTNGSEQQIVALVIAILMFGNVGAMLLAGIGLGTRRRLFFYFGIVVLAVNIILTFTDQFGVFDCVTLVLDVILLGLLIATRSQYLTAR